MTYSFNLNNTYAADGAYASLKKLGTVSSPPVILCIGSDLSVGDSLGPLVGTMLKNNFLNKNIFIYGTLSKPVTAKEVGYMHAFLAAAHPQKTVLVIDAAVGTADDVGLIKISDGGLRPGSGADKVLSPIGDISIMGVVAEKSPFNYALFSATRLNMVYRMAKIICEGVGDYLADILSNGIAEGVIWS